MACGHHAGRPPLVRSECDRYGHMTARSVYEHVWREPLGDRHTNGDPDFCFVCGQHIEPKTGCPFLPAHIAET